MRSDLLSNHLDVIGNLHHASIVHWRFFHQVIFFYLHTRVSFWYASKSSDCSSYALYSIFSEEYSLHLSDVELQLMDVVDDIMTYVEISLVYWNN
jgi:hypothetical protein